VRKKVLEVRDVELSIHEDGWFGVRARASVPSLGWRDPELVPHVSVMAPRDGIYDVDFIAAAPDRGAASVIDVLVVESAIKLPSTVRGVRVHASANSMVGLLRELAPTDARPPRL
jgi:hypothetical protein